MAERSFSEEIKLLRAADGDVIKVEGILAVTKGLLEAGVAYVGGYQGSPISHLIDVMAQSQEILDELGVRFEANSSEATAAAMLGASVNYPLRGAVAWKSTVGTNVASDALSHLASAGVVGGALIIVGEDYGEGASIMQERTHAFAMKSQMWLLDPRPELNSIRKMVKSGFELSEASNTPVMLQLRIRACHLYGELEAENNIAPAFTVADALKSPRRDDAKIVQAPSTFLQEQKKIEERRPAAIDFIKKAKLNDIEPSTKNKNVGLILQGGLYNSVIRALNDLDLADVYGAADIPLYVLNVTYPLIEDEVVAFCSDKDAILIIEEGQPNYIEQALGGIFVRNGVKARLHGKDMLPEYGEYKVEQIKKGLGEFLDRHQRKTASVRLIDTVSAASAAFPDPLPARPPGLCTGCPERPLLTSLLLLQKEIGDIHVSSDIGCHSFSVLPPFNLGNTILGYGLSAASASALHDKDGSKRSLTIMGDGGFWHNGLTTGIASAAFNNNNNVFVIVDNGYSAATGGQDIPSSADNLAVEKGKNVSIEKAIASVGVNYVRKVHTYNISHVLDTVRLAMTSSEQGPKIIIAEGECMLNRQRREKPKVQARIDGGKRVVKSRFYVDARTCTGDHACIRLSGCPSLTVRPNPSPLRDDPVAYVNNSCVGCGVCGEVAHAAVLCPSFSRVDIVSNPTRWDRWIGAFRQSVIAFLQDRRERSALRAVA